MTLRIYPVRLGITFSYIVRGKSTIMIDAGAPKQTRHFIEACARLAIRPQEIELIVLTHGHWDHIGSAKEIKELTGAEIAMHEQEKDCLEASFGLPMHGATSWGRVMAGAIKMAGKIRHDNHIDTTSVDVVLRDGVFPLVYYGIPGKVIHTPGHSPGSVTVLLDDGAALVGDLATGGSPVGFKPGIPTFADDLEALKKSWRKLLDAGAKTIYPSHGRRFPASRLQELL